MSWRAPGSAGEGPDQPADRIGQYEEAGANGGRAMSVRYDPTFHGQPRSLPAAIALQVSFWYYGPRSDSQADDPSAAHVDRGWPTRVWSTEQDPNGSLNRSLIRPVRGWPFARNNKLHVRTAMDAPNSGSDLESVLGPRGFESRILRV